ncbi:MAG: TorF family putative porin [Candidatus Aminicenantes bacterium]|nr:TorF family putative porin [Candidatus Aminicenantes bacterium]
MKKRHFLYLALFIYFGFLAANLKAEVVYQVDAASRYIWRGFDLNPNKKPVIQPSIDIAFGQSGFSLNLWSSISFVRKDLNEFDLTLSYAADLSKDLSLAAGLIHYAWYFAENFKFEDDTSHEVFLSIGSPTLFLNPSLSIFYDFSAGDGIYLLLEIGHSFPLFENLGADLSASLGYNGGQWLDKGTDPGFSDLNFGLTLPFQNGPFQISVFANYTIVLLDAIGEEDHFWFGISLSYSGTGKIE